MSHAASADTNFGLSLMAASELQSLYERTDRALRAFAIERMSNHWSFKFAVAETFLGETTAVSHFLASAKSKNQWDVQIQVFGDPVRNSGASTEWVSKKCRQFRGCLNAVRRLAAEDPIALRLAVQHTLEALSRNDVGEALILHFDVRNQAASLTFTRSQIDVGLSIEGLHGQQHLNLWCWYRGAGVVANFPVNLAPGTVEKQINPVLMQAKVIHGRTAGFDPTGQIH